MGGLDNSEGSGNDRYEFDAVQKGPFLGALLPGFEIPLPSKTRR
jgi:hypothetical protein